MNETVTSLLSSLALAGVLTILAWLLQTKKPALLAAVNNLIQMAEAEIKGSKLGETKKAWVLAQLEACGIKTTARVSQMIDELVAVMNNKKTSLVEVAAAKTKTLNDPIENWPKATPPDSKCS